MRDYESLGYSRLKRFLSKQKAQIEDDTETIHIKVDPKIKWLNDFNLRDNYKTLLKKAESVIVFDNEDSVKKKAFDDIYEASWYNLHGAIQTLKSIAKFVPDNQKLQKSKSIFEGFSNTALKIVKKTPSLCDDELMNGVQAVCHMHDLRKVRPIKNAFKEVSINHSIRKAKKEMSGNCDIKATDYVRIDYVRKVDDVSLHIKKMLP